MKRCVPYSDDILIAASIQARMIKTADQDFAKGVPETNVTLHINYTQILKIKKKKDFVKRSPDNYLRIGKGDL